MQTAFLKIYQQQQRKEDEAKHHKWLRVTDKDNRFRYTSGHIVALFTSTNTSEMTTPKMWDDIWVGQSQKSQKITQLCCITVLILGVPPTVEAPPGTSH